jgi:CheY-like chemotaxis protein
VDDDPLLLTAYRRLLEHRHEVAVAESGRAALELLERDPRWDAIVSDVVMPGVDGPDLLRALEARFPALVARTAFSSAGTYTDRTAAFARSLGDRFVGKPLDRPQLEALVARLATRRPGP